ncbi:MAG: CHC2 zinc finger domain-containing protein [Desulfobacteraceae bacterium]|nr:CHC2 zinc finger domain-containing protein [Desulfobacteraceae bacterium]
MSANISEIKQSIDILGVISEAVQLRKTGKNFIGLCPFHSEKTPSFIVNPERQRFHCFGCGEGGDVFDFIQKLHGFSFREALTHLGIQRGKITPQIRAEIRERKHKQALVKEFRAWENKAADQMAMLVRCTRYVMSKATADNVERYSELWHILPVWEYLHEILCTGSDEAKYYLYKSEKNDGKIF